MNYFKLTLSWYFLYTTEKALVLDMIKAALEANEEYYKQPDAAMYALPDPEKGKIIGDQSNPDSRIDR